MDFIVPATICGRHVLKTFVLKVYFQNCMCDSVFLSKIIIGQNKNFSVIVLWCPLLVSVLAGFISFYVM